MKQISDSNELFFGNLQKKYKSLIDNLKDIIFHIDNDGKMVFVNKAWERILGYTVEESHGMHFKDFIFSDDLDNAFKIFNDILVREGEYVPHQLRGVTKQGHIIWVEISAWLSVDNDNKVIGIFGSITDITE